MSQLGDIEKTPCETVESGDDGEAAAQQRPHISQPSLLRSTAIILTCSMVMVVNNSNSTMVSIALPVIGKDLGIPEQRLQWLVSAYALSSACLLVFFGRLADLYGRKRVFLAGSLSLTIFSLALGFSQDEITIDILRSFQGIGAAAMIPSSVGILAHTFPPSRIRSIAFATFSAGGPLGGAIGRTIGGVLTQLSPQTWRSVYYLATCFSAAVLILGIFSIDADLPSTEVDRRVDWLGAFLVTAGLVSIVFVLSDGETVGWATPYIIALLMVGVICMVMFVSWERYLENMHEHDHARALASKWTPPPLMKLSILGRAKGRFAVTMCIAFLTWCSFLSWSFWVQLYYQDFLNLTPILTMIRLLPMYIVGILCNIVITVIIGRISIVYIVVFGTVATGTASLLFALIDPASSYWAFGFPAAIVSVVGADFVFASGMIFVAKVSLPHEQSLAGALFNTMTQLGTAFGLTISTIVFNRVTTRDSKQIGFAESTSPVTMNPRTAQLAGYKAAQWTTFGFAMLSALLALIFLRGVGIVGHSKQVRIQNAEREREKKQVDSTLSGDTPSMVV